MLISRLEEGKTMSQLNISNDWLKIIQFLTGMNQIKFLRCLLLLLLLSLFAEVLHI